MQTKFLFLIFLVTSIVLSAPGLAGQETRTTSNTSVGPGSAGKFNGLCYSGYRDTENPDNDIHPSIEELSQDMSLISVLTQSIRTYGTNSTLEKIPALSQKAGVDCYPGAWISQFTCENEKQTDNLIKISKLALTNVKGLNVGCEVLLRNDITEQELIGYINKVKSQTSLPVSTSEIWNTWLEHPNLAAAVDVIYVHIYPFWDGIPIDNAANYLLEKYSLLKSAYPGKPIVIGETGWPSDGKPRGSAVPGDANQRKYINDFLAVASQNNIQYFIFEIFDEKWKVESTYDIGQHWGFYNTDGALKPHMADLIPEAAQAGLSRTSRSIPAKNATLPLFLYSDGCDSTHGFTPSGWMGELATIFQNDSIYNNAKDIIDISSADNPHSEKSCIRISYKPSLNNWGGFYWQFPVNNWGIYPGYAIDKSKKVKLSFWARGMKGGEKAEFMTGGILDSSLPYHDSYSSMTTGIIVLSSEWQKYTINLANKDLSNVIGGFCWVTNYQQNPSGSTVFLDDIVFEEDTSIGIMDPLNLVIEDFYLEQNYPNPFTSSTKIEFTTRLKAFVSLKIYDSTGKEIITLANEDLPAGTYIQEWSAENQSGNIFFCRLQVGKYSQVKKLLISK